MARWLWLLVSLSAFGADQYSLENLTLKIPNGWKLHQEFRDGETIVAGFSHEDQYVRIYLSPKFQQDRNRTARTIQSRVGNWSLSVQENKLPAPVEHKSNYIATFDTQLSQYQFTGISTAPDALKAEKNAELFIDGTESKSKSSIGIQRSLTGPDFTGKKYYVGFGDDLSGFMGNEVKYDIAHTHDIFTHELGGNYIGTKIVGPGQGSSKLQSRWDELYNLMTWNDMYVQYSSGHGSTSGLQFGVSYNEIRDNALSYPAKEVIIFIMACHSGGLVEAFDQKKSQWENWGEYGRTLMVMSSSTRSELSSTGPMTDPEEPGGPSGSAGSAFGHALWKALIGHSDGFGDGGIKDGYLSLGEIIDYATWKTKNMAGHNPIHTGTFNRELIMNRVPSEDVLKRITKGSSEILSDTEVQAQIEKLNDELSLLR